MTHEYVGTKIVTSWPQEKDGQPGYAVKYEDGYISWSPAASFETAYIDIGNVAHLPAHQQRVIAEKAVLDDRLKKLSEFIDNVSAAFGGLDNDEKERLEHQRFAMNAYSEILGERISAFAQ